MKSDKRETVCDDEGEVVIHLTAQIKKQMSEFLAGERLDWRMRDSLLLLVKASKGKKYFVTNLEELTDIFYLDYYKTEGKDVEPTKRHKDSEIYSAIRRDESISRNKGIKKYKGMVRRRLDYFEAKRVTEKGHLYFEILDIQCAGGAMSSTFYL